MIEDAQNPFDFQRGKEKTLLPYRARPDRQGRISGTIITGIMHAIYTSKTETATLKATASPPSLNIS